MNRQHIKPGQRIVHNLSKPLAERVKSRKVCGPYYFTPPKADSDYRSFYLDSDFMPSLRWEWCDDIANINHAGWFTDEFGDSDTIRGVVFRLPHNKGFLAGWSMGEGMISEIDTTIHDDEHSAAYCADGFAERVAEINRESNS